MVSGFQNNHLRLRAGLVGLRIHLNLDQVKLDPAGGTYWDTVTSDKTAPCSATRRCHSRRAVSSQGPGKVVVDGASHDDTPVVV